MYRPAATVYKGFTVKTLENSALSVVPWKIGHWSKIECMIYLFLVVVAVCAF